MVSCWDADRSKRKHAAECHSILSTVYERLTSSTFDIFFSHAWKTKQFLSYVYRILTREGYKVWYDQEEMGFDLRESMQSGIADSKIVLVCLGTIYQSSVNCMYELREAKKQNKTMVGLFIEEDYWQKALKEVKDTCDFAGKMFHDVGSLASKAEWYQESGPSPQLLRDTEAEMKPLLKILRNALKSSAPTFEAQTKPSGGAKQGNANTSTPSASGDEKEGERLRKGVTRDSWNG